jgi:hypothetical protein
MHKLAIVLLLTLLVGCASSPHYDAIFGDAVREARQRMTLDPKAGNNPDPVAGMDGKAAHEATVLYQKTFITPPPVVNVINIGGATGNSR